MTKLVEFYIRSAGDPKTVHPLATTYIDEHAEEYSRTKALSCPFCGRRTDDMAPIRRPPAGWPEVLLVICDQGRHRLDES